MFAYFEYDGEDFEADQRQNGADPKTQEWWAICVSLPTPFETRKQGEWWAAMEEVFHIK